MLKNKKKLLLVALLMTSMLLLTSCGGNNNTNTGFNPYIGGSEAIQLDFITQLEEGLVQDNGHSSFNIQIRLTNNGEYDIDPALGDLLQLTLDGINHAQFNMNPADKTLYLQDPFPGTTKLIDGSTRPGQMYMMSFEDLSYLQDVPGDIDRKLLFDLCYDYETKSALEICLADDVTDALISKDEQRICSVNEIKTVYNSAGPVQITELKEMPMGGSKVSVIFKVEKVGSGDIFRAGSANACDKSSSNIDKNKIEVNVYLSDNTAGTILCTGFENRGNGANGIIVLYEETPGTVTCTIESTSGADLFYEDILNIDLRYRYSDVFSKNIIIKDLGTLE